MVEAACLQSLESLKYWWVGAEIQDAEMKKMKSCEVRFCQDGEWVMVWNDLRTLSV